VCTVVSVSIVTASSFHIGRRPDPLAHGARDVQDLPGDIPMQRIHESPESGLHRQLGDFQDARQDRIASDEAQLIQPGKADVQAEQDAQHEAVQVHGTRNPLRCQSLFHQRLEVQLLQHGDHRQQAAVGCQILSRKSRKAWKH
jgi:hypothetical protein